MPNNAQPDLPSLEELAPHRYDRECYEVAGGIAQKWPHLKEDSGFYVHPERGPGDHGWNIAPDGTIVDMTAAQHDYAGPEDEPQEEPEQWPAPQHPEIIRPTDPEYSRYVSWSRHEPQAQSLAHQLGYHEGHDDNLDVCPRCQQRTAGANVMYHAAPSDRRGSIQGRGLNRPNGNFVFSDPTHAKEYGELVFGPNAHDVYAVNVEGLPLENDPNHSTAQVCRMPIDPTRLQLQHTAPTIDPWHQVYTNWHIEDETLRTAKIVATLIDEPMVPLPSKQQRVGASEVRWFESEPGVAVIHSHGGSCDDRTLAEQVVKEQLAAFGYRRATFTIEAEHKHSGWDDIMAKAKRLILSGNVTLLRNGYNNIVGHVIGDHGEYNTEIGRDDPNTRTITTWQCECPWDQYAWQRTRQWKKYEGRPCAHVMALYWSSLAAPLDDYSPDQHGALDPGQAAPPPAGQGAPPAGKLPASQPEGPTTPTAPMKPPGVPDATIGPPTPGPPGGMPQAPLAPPGQSDVLPPSPMEQLQMMQPPMPGATPGGMPAPPGSVSVPGAKLPTPFNPIQYPGGTYSKVAAGEFAHGQIVRLKNNVFGTAVGKSDAHGAGQYQEVQAGATGEVLGQDPTTGWVEVIVPLDDSGPMEPYHVQLFCEPGDLDLTRIRPPGPFIKRRT